MRVEDHDREEHPREEGNQEEDSSGTTTPAYNLHKSCDRCGFKKRRCDGGHPCRRCIRLGATCSYSKRRPRAPRPKPPPPSPSPEPVPNDSASDNDTSVEYPATPQARRDASDALGPPGRVSLKRCRLSPSPATGLVGTQENIFLSNYFDCVGFLPFTSQSHIRETLIQLFTASSAAQHSDSEDYSTTEQHCHSIVPADCQLPAGPSTCVFWCAVALGSLVKGRPIESVEKYSRLARDALANGSGPANAETARAWAILAYMSDFCGNHDNFHVFLATANAILCDVQDEGNQTMPEGLFDVVKHGETIKLFVGDLDSEELESFCNKEQDDPDVNEAATERDIFQFVMRSYRSFELVLYQRLVGCRPTNCGRGGDGKPSSDFASADPVGADLLSGSRPHFFASLMREGAGSYSSGMLDMMAMMTRDHSCQFQAIEHAANRSDIRAGVGGLIINGTLVYGKITRNDIAGALDKLEACGEVVQQYPGLCRFTMW